MRQFSLDMIPGGAQTAVACNQYESGDTWVFALYYDGGRYSIPADADVSITGTKPDGAAYKVAGTIVDNAVQIVVTDQITACAGRSIAEILVESETDGTTLYSANFPLLVEPAAVQGEFSPSEIPSAIVDTDGNVYYSAEYIPEVSGGVPTEVRQAMKTLFEKTAYYPETGLEDEVAVITAWAEATTGITVSPASASVSSASPTAQLSAVTTPAGGAVTWASSNTAVATVSSTGLVTAVGNGVATITATSGTVSASCTVTVTGFRTLTGIEAVYTQSGTVYDTASLDDLKTDLVVTASYDNGTTATITNYTLSGTLAEGTSTITVSYGGFTDTFSVTVTHWDPVRSITWSGGGADKSSSVIDATQYDAYYELPFVEGSSQLIEGATESSLAFRIYDTYLYSDAEMTNLVGRYEVDTGEITESGRAASFCPNYAFGTKIKVAPHGYYARIMLNKNSASFSSNGNFMIYIQANGSTVTLE